MEYDAVVVCAENDFYLGDMICQELEARGKRCLFNLRSGKSPRNVWGDFLKSSPIYIAVVSSDFLAEENFHTITNRKLNDLEVYTYLFINEENIEIPKNWTDAILIDAMAEWEDSVLDEIVRPKSPRVPTQAFGANGTEEGKQMGRYLSERIEDLILPDEPKSISVKRALKYLLGNGVVKDEDRAYSLLTRAVNENNEDVEALYYLGVFNEVGIGCPSNPSEAQKFYEDSVNKGFTPSMLRLGYCALIDESPEVQEEGLNILQRCREAGDVRATYWIGVAAESAEDMENAYEYYSEAAEDGFPPAQNALGCLYYEGIGVTANADKALEWFKLAAGQGLSVAQANLADLMIQRYGVSDEAEALIMQSSQAGNEKGKALQELLMQYKEEMQHQMEQEELARIMEEERERRAQERIDAIKHVVGYTFNRIFNR